MINSPHPTRSYVTSISCMSVIETKIVTYCKNVGCFGSEVITHNTKRMLNSVCWKGIVYKFSNRKSSMVFPLTLRMPILTGLRNVANQ